MFQITAITVVVPSCINQNDIFPPFRDRTANEHVQELLSSLRTVFQIQYGME